MAAKFYAVRKGKKTGIFETWEECKESVYGYSCAEYKSFPTMEQAKEYLSGMTQETFSEEEYVPFYVDGSFNSATGEFSYGMVVLFNGQVLQYNGKYKDEELASMHNVAGEIKGSEAAMRYAMEHGLTKIAIYHDYEGIAKWCQGLWKTNKEGTRAYKAFYEEARKKIDIKFVKVAGHSGDTYNEMADRLAKEALGLV
ncbi:MAG: viroplasmin family protein [Suilimivivens sp.]